MADSNITLTPTDRAILESYKLLCEGLSEYIGDAYEIVLHSLESLEHSVVKIINGYYTGRSEGAPITPLALAMLAKIEAQQERGYITYHTRNKKGEPLKSSTIAIQGEDGRIIGVLCINLYMNTPFAQVIGSFFLDSQTLQEHAQESESLADTAEDLILPAVVAVRSQVMDSAAVSQANKNKEIISRLYARGIFNLKDSVVRTAEILGISKNTVYMHIRNLNT